MCEAMRLVRRSVDVKRRWRSTSQIASQLHYMPPHATRRNPGRTSRDARNQSITQQSGPKHDGVKTGMMAIRKMRLAKDSMGLMTWPMMATGDLFFFCLF